MRARRSSPPPSPRSRLRRSAAVVVLAASPVALVPASPAAAAPPGVFVVGDSLTVGASQFGGLEDKFVDAGFSPAVQARTGRGVPWGLSVLQAQGRALPGTVVVALGTNDVAAGRSVQSFADHVDAIMSTVGPTRQVLWLNLDMQGPPWGAQAARFNRVLAERTGRYPNLAVADWNSYVDANRSWVVSDGIHLNGRGYRQRAWFMLWQVQAAS